jgi:hypothetical protein
VVAFGIGLKSAKRMMMLEPHDEMFLRYGWAVALRPSARFRSLEGYP